MGKTLKLLLKIAVSAGLICLLYSKLDWSDLADKLRGADLRWLGLAFGLMVLNTFVNSAKWWLFLDADGIRQPILTLWASHITASFFNLFLPSTIGGDAYRIADIGGRTGEHARVAASILADRITGFFALSIYGFAASLLARPLVVEWKDWFYLPSSLAIVALAGLTAALCSEPFFAFCIRLVPGRRLREKVQGIAGKIIGAMRGYMGKGKVLLATMLLSFLFQFELLLAVWAITKAIGLSIPLPTFFLFLPVKTFLEMIPVSVFGLGLRDLGYTIFMTAMGFGEKAAANAALISAAEVILTVIYASMGGVVFVCRRSASSERAADESEITDNR